MTDRTDIPAWVDGILTPVEKLHVHKVGLRHKAVSVFVMADDEVLIQRRALGKYHTPGLWANTCCTHPLWEESGLTCANRRLQQELGITGLSPEFRDQIEYRADVGDGLIEHEVVEIFVAQTDKMLHVKPNPDEVMEINWITLSDLTQAVEKKPERFTPWLRIYLDQFADRIFRT